ncbi:MAG: hypothetical protein M9958_00495 [Chitinophagales bacterium]|nr:hypothetical protein [Chitinophagales bacterium]
MNFFDTKECEWSDLELFLNGAKVTKIQSAKYKKSVEKEHLYAAGSNPISIQRGNKSYTGSFRLLKGAVDDINRAVKAAGGEDLLDASFTCVINYKKKGNRLLQIDTLIGLEFTEYERGMEQNAKSMPIELPILFLELKSV